jgi:hypothetical protein
MSVLAHEEGAQTGGDHFNTKYCGITCWVRGSTFDLPEAAYYYMYCFTFGDLVAYGWCSFVEQDL